MKKSESTLLDRMDSTKIEFVDTKFEKVVSKDKTLQEKLKKRLKQSLKNKA